MYTLQLIYSQNNMVSFTVFCMGSDKHYQSWGAPPNISRNAYDDQTCWKYLSRSKPCVLSMLSYCMIGPNGDRAMHNLGFSLRDNIS